MYQKNHRIFSCFVLLFLRRYIGLWRTKDFDFDRFSALIRVIKYCKYFYNKRVTSI